MTAFGTNRSPWAARTVAVCAVTAAAELALIVATTPDWADYLPGGLALLAFMLGPPLFLAVMAWRRRSRLAWGVRLFRLAIVVAVIGLGYFGFDCLSYHTDPAYRAERTTNPALIPLVQWVLVLAVWLILIVQEGREKRAAKSSS